MVLDLYTEIKKELFMKMGFMDTSMKGIKESPEYEGMRKYNEGIKDAIRVIDKYEVILRALNFTIKAIGTIISLIIMGIALIIGIVLMTWGGRNK